MLPAISVVIATYDRADLLPRALRSLQRQTLDDPLYEVIVVDNNSSDATRDVVERFVSESGTERASGGRMPVVSYVFEPIQGLSQARNTGFSVARGEFVAYIDDDAMASPGWLASILEAFRSTLPEVDVVGGPVHAVFAGRGTHRPGASERAGRWGDRPRFLRGNETFSGVNVAFRRDSLMRAGGFDVRLGMMGDTMRMGEDTDIVRRIAGSPGGRAPAYYEPRASVYHIFDDTRLSMDHCLKRQFACGQAEYHMDRTRGRRRSAGLVFHGLRLVWHLAWAGAALPLARPSRNWPAVWVSPAMLSVGYFAAAVGRHPVFKRGR